MLRKLPSRQKHDRCKEPRPGSFRPTGVPPRRLLGEGPAREPLSVAESNQQRGRSSVVRWDPACLGILQRYMVTRRRVARTAMERWQGPGLARAAFRPRAGSESPAKRRCPRSTRHRRWQRSTSGRPQLEQARAQPPSCSDQAAAQCGSVTYHNSYQEGQLTEERLNPSLMICKQHMSHHRCRCPCDGRDTGP